MSISRISVVIQSIQKFSFCRKVVFRGDRQSWKTWIVQLFTLWWPVGIQCIQRCAFECDFNKSDLNSRAKCVFSSELLVVTTSLHSFMIIFSQVMNAGRIKFTKVIFESPIEPSLLLHSYLSMKSAKLLFTDCARVWLLPFSYVMITLIQFGDNYVF